MTMSSEYNWRDDDRLVAFLSGCLRRGQLAICLGAGVSVPFKIPTWNSLIDGLAKAADLDPVTDPDLLAAASYLEEAAYGGKRRRLLEALRAELYRSVDADSIAEQLANNKTLRAIGSLAVPSIAGSVKSIISFNYDDMIETFLERYGVKARTIIACNYLNEPADVNIFHPHGFLPFDQNRPAGSTIVLTSRDFMKAKNNWVGELWDATVSEVFRRHVVLFIGVSGSDDRLMELIWKSWKHHNLASINCPFFGVRLDAGSEPEFNKWNERGVYVRAIDDFEDDIATFLYRIKDHGNNRLERSSLLS